MEKIELGTIRGHKVFVELENLSDEAMIREKTLVQDHLNLMEKCYVEKYVDRYYFPG